MSKVQEQLSSMQMAAMAIFDTIKESGEAGAPLGPMYAATMSILSYEEFEKIIGVMKTSGVIRVDGFHVARYVSVEERVAGAIQV